MSYLFLYNKYKEMEVVKYGSRKIRFKESTKGII